MNKKEWKAEYGATRALLEAAITMNRGRNCPARKIALETVWGIAQDKGLSNALHGRYDGDIYPISEFAWAVRTNSMNY